MREDHLTLVLAVGPFPFAMIAYYSSPLRWPIYGAIPVPSAKARRQAGVMVRIITHPPRYT